MNRKIFIDNIIKQNSRFVAEVKAYTKLNLYDINVHAESALIPILNAVFNLELVNANILKKNYPAVDLVDEKNRVAFQITATSSTEKIISTLQIFFENQLDKQFDVLYFYILTEKADSYSTKKIKAEIKENFEFDIARNILDSNDIIKKISEIPSTEKIGRIVQLYETEFSDIQIESRQKKFIEGFLLNEPEHLYLNLLDIAFSEKLFIADILFDEEKVKKGINDYREAKGKRKIVNFKKGKLLKAALIQKEIFNSDWITREGKLITFRNLHDHTEGLASVIDKGTIEEISSYDYFKTSIDYVNNFKDLLRRCLIEYVEGREMEWVADREIIRYKNNPIMPNIKRLKWVGKNKAEKTVIFEMISKKKEGEDQHIICYRNMAFRPSFHYIGEIWFLGINPTWSFTNPGGFYTSRFESSYLSGLKKKEQNNAVYYQFRFFAYQLSKSELFIDDYPYLTIFPKKPLEFIPKIVDKKWLPPKEHKAINSKEAEIEIDNELTLALF